MKRAYATLTDKEKRHQIDLKIDSQPNDFFKSEASQKSDFVKGFRYEKNNTSFENEFSDKIYPGFKQKSKCGLIRRQRRRLIPFNKSHFRRNGFGSRKTTNCQKENTVW